MEQREAQGQSEAEQEASIPPRVVSLLFGGDTSPAQTFEKWLSLVRKRSGAFRPSGFPRRNSRIEVMPSGSFSLFSSGDLSDQLVRTESTRKEEIPLIFDQPPEISLWERLGNAASLDIESSDFSWNMLSSLHHTEHGSSSEHSEDETNKALEVTVNSGGVVFFALFNSPGHSGLPKEAAAVIKFASSKMATQAELLGYEFARLLRVKTPQARIVHNSSQEWQHIRHAAENARAVAVSNNDEVGEMTCSELLEALELSRCLFLMSYIHGSPLLENSKAFNSLEAACITASSLGRVLMLDLILRNEDRLPCRQLGWRGNPANLMISDRLSSPSVDKLEDSEGTTGPDDVASIDSSCSLSDEENAAVIHEFRGSFRAALRDLEGFHLFLLQLYQKLDGVSRVFWSIISKSSEEYENNDVPMLDFPSLGGGYSTPCPSSKQMNNELHGDSDMLKSATKSSSAGTRGSSDSVSPMSRDSCNKYIKGSAEAPRSLRMTMKLRDLYKNPKVDPETLKEIEQWNEALKIDVIKFCQENNFHSGFFDGTESNMVADAYELKVRLEHIIERVALISDAANTERPSLVVNNLFIGGALAARSKYTLQHLGITHINDDDDANISDLFEEASEFIDYVDRAEGKVLVHCFEGKSRSATVVLAYLMLRKSYTLAKAWNLLKKVHRRAQPNDGFAKALLALDKKLHGKVSMDWQHKRPEMKVCPICSKNVGLSTSSLKLHLQKAHKRLSAGSVDSAMTMEIQKTIESLRISRGGSLSPSQKLTKAFADELSL
ncbi:hypothetical protein PR202_ga23059 [Eleusine coracana subsp. coracana]|uniref:Dual specificity protein phosphatase PHS1 n=1 Tax=Eleusine coracana subsp. coracana TaxID=191504 RepID=A0AAV5D588_ELECO|nr:hypothetical protein PR202_ga23059 [Eleusine coracana subsp. coracana]